MDKRIASWILEFLLRQPIEDWVPNMLLSNLPVSDDDIRLKKTILLRRISSEISKNCVSEKILDSLEMIEELDRDIGTIASDSMKSAYCGVVLECTAQILRVNSSDGEIERFWKCRVSDTERSDGSGLVSDRLKEMEAVVGSLETRESLFSRDTLKEALDSVRVYLVEAMRDMGPTFLEFAVGMMFEESNVDDVTVEPEASVEVDVRRKLPSSLIGTCEEGTLPRDRSQLDNKYESLPTPEVNKIVEALKSSCIDLQTVVEDPLPDALEMAARVQSNMGREQINQKELEDKEVQIDADIHNYSVDKDVENDCVEGIRNRIQCNKNHDGISRPSLMVRNETARTYEWDEDSVDTISENSQNVARRIRLPTQKHRAVSPLKKAEITRYVRRRRTKRWSSLEEETLRNGVAEYGKGKWKFILNCYREVFEDRTEVDLKDKWRNMT